MSDPKQNNCNGTDNKNTAMIHLEGTIAARK